MAEYETLTTDNMLREGERLDDTGFGGIRVIQNEGLGYGVDAVLLAAWAAGELGAKAIDTPARVCDFGCGSGIVGFVLLHKLKDLRVTGVDIRESAVDRAARAAVINGLMDRMEFVCADIADMATGSTEPAAGRGTDDMRKYDAIVSNPPYFRRNAAIPSATSDKFIARHETTAGIDEFAGAAAAMLKTGGSLYLVHRPDRLPDLFEAMRKSGIEPKSMCMVVPKKGDAANIVLIHGIKGAGRELRILPEIAVHDSAGGYTELIERIYERLYN